MCYNDNRNVFTMIDLSDINTYIPTYIHAYIEM